MKKNVLKLFVAGLLLISNATFASQATYNEPLNPPNPPESNVIPSPKGKEIKQMDKMIEQRLNLTPEQIKVLRANKQKNIRELEKIIAKMENTRKKIRNVHLLGLPKYQEDLRTAPYKMELVLLKQNADMIRSQNRKTFESVLTPEQKVEFKKFKSELPRRQPPRHFN